MPLRPATPTPPLAPADSSAGLAGTLLEATSDGVLVVSSAGAVTAYNRRLLDLWRLPDESARSGSARLFLEAGLPHLRDPDGFRARVRRLATDPVAEEHALVEFVDGRVLEAYTQPWRDRGEVVGRVWCFSDATETRLADDALRRSEERYGLAVRAVSDAVWEWDLETGEFYLSPRWAGALGVRGDSRDEWLSRIPARDREALEHALRAHLDGEGEQVEEEHRMVLADGRVRWVLTRGIAVRDADRRALRLAGAQKDVTAHRAARRRLARQAYRDPVTGLPNRNLLLRRLQHLRAADAARGLALLYLDLDNFKVVNDSLGHACGDELLAAAARRLRTCLRPGDVAARIGGDEFALLLPGVQSPAEGVAFADRVHAALGPSIRVGGREVFASAAVGVVVDPLCARAPAELLRDADTAMYRAKAEGPGRTACFGPEMHRAAVRRLHLEMDLRSALERGELRLHYQPIVSLRTGAPEGMEALLRWVHPERGLLSPAEFIHVAEETGLVLPIARWALAEACRQVRAWQDRGALPPGFAVNVNVSGRHFAGGDLAQDVFQALDAAGVPGARLKVEVTETALAANTEAAARALRALRGRGVRVCIDDFGTGYSSLATLHRLPFDTLKVDRGFVHDLGGAGEGIEIVRTILSLSANLGRESVAEGVETEEQRRLLMALGCRAAQGYLFARPLDPAAAGAYLALRGGSGPGDGE